MEMKRFVYEGMIDENGKAKIFNRHQMDEELQLMAGQNFIMTIEEQPKETSHKQRKYFRGYVVPEFVKGFKALGISYGNQDMYRILMNDFFYEDIESPLNTDGFVRVYLSFRDGGGITTKLFMQKMEEEIIPFAAENLNVVINDPDPNWKENTHQNVGA